MRRWDWGDPAQDLEQSTDLGRFFEADGEGNCQRRMDAASPTSHRSAIIWPRPFLLFISFLPFSFPSLSLSLSLYPIIYPAVFFAPASIFVVVVAAATFISILNLNPLNISPF